MDNFIILLNSLLEYTIVQANQNKTLESYPFITFQSISRSRDGLNILSRELSEDETNITETLDKNIKETIQVDFFGKTIQSTREITNNFIDDIDFVYKQSILDNNFSVISIGDIKDNTSLESIKSLHRLTCDIVIDYTENVSRNIENMEKISYNIIEGNVNITVERE